MFDKLFISIQNRKFISKVKSWLLENNIDTRTNDLFGSINGECFGLEFDENSMKWCVYYFERGQKTWKSPKLDFHEAEKIFMEEVLKYDSEYKSTERTSN